MELILRPLYYNDEEAESGTSSCGSAVQREAVLRYRDCQRRSRLTEDESAVRESVINYVCLSIRKNNDAV